MISSRVPGTRPGRPIPACAASRSTVRRIFRTALNAPAGLSCAMYSNCSLRSTSAARSHLTRTLRPFSEHRLYFLVGREVSRVSLPKRLPDFLNLPFIEGDIFPNGLGREEGAAALGCLGKFVKFILELAIYAESKNV